MKFFQFCIIILIGTINLFISKPIQQDTNTLLQSCLKLKSQAPVLKLNCELLIETSNSNDLLSQTAYYNIDFVSIDEYEENTKKINKTEKEKLSQMINDLKGKNEEIIF